MVVAAGVAAWVRTWPLIRTSSDIASHRRRGQTFRYRADRPAQRIEAFPQHVLWHCQRRQQTDPVAEQPGAHDDHTVLDGLAHNLQRLVGGRRLLRLPITYELGEHHRPEPTDIAD